MKKKKKIFFSVLTFIRFQFDNRTHFATIAHAILFNFSECFCIKSQTALHPLTKWQTQLLLFDEKSKNILRSFTHTFDCSCTSIRIGNKSLSFCAQSVPNFNSQFYINNLYIRTIHSRTALEFNCTR